MSRTFKWVLASLLVLGTSAGTNEDTPGWDNGTGRGCQTYASEGWCAGGAVAHGHEWTAGAAYAFPEKNCVVCGKESAKVCHCVHGQAATGADFTETIAKGLEFAQGLANQGRTRGLNLDEAAAVNIYTQAGPAFFYAGLNAAMGGYTPRKHADLPGYLPFIRLLLSAMF